MFGLAPDASPDVSELFLAGFGRGLADEHVNRLVEHSYEVLGLFERHVNLAFIKFGELLRTPVVSSGDISSEVERNIARAHGHHSAVAVIDPHLVGHQTWRACLGIVTGHW